MIKRKPSNGFSVVAIVIAFVAIAIIGLVGWYIWQDRQEKQSNNHKSEDTSKADGKRESSNASKLNPVDPTEGGKYLAIKEWGIRIKLPKMLVGDVEYGVFKLNNGDQIVYIASKKITAKSSDGLCNLKPTNDTAGQGVSGGLVAIARSKTEPSENEREASFYGIGGYWYTVTPSRTVCFEGDTGQEQGEFKSLMMDVARRSLSE